MRRASGSAIPLRSTSSSICTLRQAPTLWPQYTCPPRLFERILLRQHDLYNVTHDDGSRRTINALTAAQIIVSVERDISLPQRYMAGRVLRAWYELSNAGLLPAAFQIVFDPINEDLWRQWREAWYTPANPYQPIPIDILSRLMSGAMEWVERYAEHVIFAYNTFLPFLASPDAEFVGTDDFLLEKAIALLRAHPSPVWTDDDLALTVRSNGYADKRSLIIFLSGIIHRLRNACINIILATTGMRLLELVMLEEECAWDASKKGDYKICVRVWKTSVASQGKEAKLPIPEITFKAIDALSKLGAAARKHGGTRRLLVTLTRFACTPWGQPTGKGVIPSAIRDFATHLGIAEHIHSHQYRKTLAMFVIYQDPEHLELVRRLFSHKSLRMTLRYIMSIPDLSDDIRSILIQHYKDLLSEIVGGCVEGKIAGKAGQRIKASLAAAHISPASLLDNGQDTLEQYIDGLAADGMVVLHRTPWAVICTKAPTMTQRAPCDRPNAPRHRRLTPDVSRCDPIHCPFAVFTEETIPYLNKEIAFHEWLRTREGCSDRQIDVSSSRIRECRSLLADLAASDNAVDAEMALGDKGRDDG